MFLYTPGCFYGWHGLPVLLYRWPPAKACGRSSWYHLMLLVYHRLCTKLFKKKSLFWNFCWVFLLDENSLSNSCFFLFVLLHFKTHWSFFFSFLVFLHKTCSFIYIIVGFICEKGELFSWVWRLLIWNLSFYRIILSVLKLKMVQKLTTSKKSTDFTTKAQNISPFWSYFLCFFQQKLEALGSKSFFADDWSPFLT